MVGQAGPALPALILLVLFPFVRTLGERTRPEAAALDCDRVAAADVAGLERCLTVRPDDVEILADLGGAYERIAEWERAEALYRRALAVDPEDGDIRVRLGHVLLQLGDPSGARREGEAALAVQPGRAAPLALIRQAAAIQETGRDR